jgi:aminoglycoside phosphotransferase (APT) family kinase protein
MKNGSGSLEPDVRAALERLRLLAPGESVTASPLTGGVSSDIWRIETPRRVFAVKRALAKLKVAADWRAPVERSRYEHDWIETARGIVPSAAPELLGYDAEAGLIAMRYYDPSEFKLWKSELRDGRVDPAVAARVGAVLARIHAGTAGQPEIAERFPTDAIFHAIRLEPYLVAAATHHPELAARLHWLVEQTAATKRALVHGDASPKNILIGPDGPMFLDAECAWWGDPAFDLAFCLNHLLLKCLWVPAARDALLASFALLAETYLDGVTWEEPEDIEARAAHLLAGLFLARVDGKSPVEYITRERDRDHVRLVARLFLLKPTDSLSEFWRLWAEEIGA